MKNDLVLIIPQCPERAKSARLNAVLDQALDGFNVTEIIHHSSELHTMRGKRILFAVVLGSSGINLEYYAMLKKIRLDQRLFVDCLGVLLVDGMGELYTKYIARELIFSANQAGCAFIGRPLVEGTMSLNNFTVIAQLHDLDQYGAYEFSTRDLVQRLLDWQKPAVEQKEMLVLHASSRKTSNTLQLWKMVEEKLENWQITEICLHNGKINDCAGCPYSTCMHYGEKGGCFYGGIISSDVFPAIERCNSLMLLCPNYNDALSANMTAFVNRLTALFRRQRFYDKKLQAIVVSGYSGSDIVAGQLIAGMCMNKSFFLPPRFCMLETANNPGEVLHVPGIKDRAATFAASINGS